MCRVLYPITDFYFCIAMRPVTDVNAWCAPPTTGSNSSAVKRGTVFATQFHPEERRKGLQLYRNFGLSGT